MRECIYRLVRKAEKGDLIGKTYNIYISTVAIISIIPMIYKNPPSALVMIERITVYLLFVDYIFRWLVYDYSCGKKKPLVFVIYPFTPMALIDIISLMPSMGIISSSFKILRLLRIVKILNYSDSFNILQRVFRRQKKILTSVLLIAVGYIFVSALYMFTIEPDSFNSFFEATYWATTALTTVGYGDVYPVTNAGRLVSMISSLFGIAIIALPSGIVTGGMIEEFNANKLSSNEDDNVEVDRIYSNQTKRLFMDKKVKSEFLWIVLGVILNSSLFTVANECDLPAWLDVTGTVMVSMFVGPSAGVIVGLINNCIISTIRLGSEGLVYFFVSGSAAVVIGLMTRDRDNKPSLKRLPLALVVASIVSTIIDGLVMFYITGEINYGYEIIYYNQLVEKGFSSFVSVFLAVFRLKVVDFAVAGLLTTIAYFIVKRKRENGQ